MIREKKINLIFIGGNVELKTGKTNENVFLNVKSPSNSQPKESKRVHNKI